MKICCAPGCGIPIPKGQARCAKHFISNSDKSKAWRAAHPAEIAAYNQRRRKDGGAN